MAIVVEEESIDRKRDFFREHSDLLFLGLHMDPILHFRFPHEAL
jgi:hypothetical protein